MIGMIHIDGREECVQFLSDDTDSIYPAASYWVDENGCLEMREVSIVSPESRSSHYMHVFDLQDHEVKMLSITETGQRVLRELIAQVTFNAVERQRLLESQANSAARFKYLKMLLRTKAK